MPAEAETPDPETVGPADARQEQACRSTYSCVEALEKLRQLSRRIHDRAASQATPMGQPATE